jgi:hypothetical protein
MKTTVGIFGLILGGAGLAYGAKRWYDYNVGPRKDIPQGEEGALPESDIIPDILTGILAVATIAESITLIVSDTDKSK